MAASGCLSRCRSGPCVTVVRVRCRVAAVSEPAGRAVMHQAVSLSKHAAVAVFSVMEEHVAQCSMEKRNTCLDTIFDNVIHSWLVLDFSWD